MFEFRTKMLEEKIRETGKNLQEWVEQPQGTSFEFQVLQIVMEAKQIEQDVEQGFDPATLKLFYSISD